MAVLNDKGFYTKTIANSPGNLHGYDGVRFGNTVVETKTAGFFNPVVEQIQAGDIIMVSCIDGQNMFVVSSITYFPPSITLTDYSASGGGAVNVSYDDSVSPHYGSTNVQGALDALKASSGASAIAHYRSVASNGIDSPTSLVSLTLNNALTNLGASGVVQVYDGTYNVPTVSLINKQIIGISQGTCVIQSTSGVFPIPNNSNAIISNIKFKGTVANPIPIIISATGLVLEFNNCIFDASGSISCEISDWAGTITFNNCQFLEEVFIHGNSGGNVIFNDCDINDCVISLTSGSLASIIMNNSTLTVSGWTGGSLNLNNCNFNANSVLNADATLNNYLYINGGTTRNMFSNSLNYHIINKSGNAPFLINNLDTVDTLNIYNGNGVINGFNDTTRTITANYNLKGYDSLILADATAGDITITLFLTSNFNNLNNLRYEVVKTDNTANQVILVVTSPDVFANGDSESTTQYSLIHKNDVVSMVAYPILSTWRRI